MGVFDTGSSSQIPATSTPFSNQTSIPSSNLLDDIFGGMGSRPVENSTPTNVGNLLGSDVFSGGMGGMQQPIQQPKQAQHIAYEDNNIRISLQLNREE
jgi:hypothetical protein